MKKWGKFIFLVVIMLVTGCMKDTSQEKIGDIANNENNVSEDQMNRLSEEQPESQPEDMQSIQSEDSLNDQMEERGIVCENPYFFPQNTSLMTSEISYIKGYTAVTNNYNWFETRCKTELELRWLKQYDNGCLAKLSIVPFSGDMPDYMDETRMNMYFYVTADEIYRISYHDLQNIGLPDAEEKLIANGELVCCPEGVEDSLEEEEAGTHTSVVLQGSRISYDRADIEDNGDRGYYENFIWEEGKGLVGYMSGYDTGTPEDKKIVYLEDIIYGTTEQTQDREIICENPYFFPQDVSIWTTDITCGDYLQTYEGELELHWLKQYDDGCLARLSVAPFDYGDEEDKYYLGISYFEMYFYVTSDEIYRIDFFVSSADGTLENRDAYIDYNDRLLMTVLNTDERLVEYGNLVCSPESVLNEVEEGEYGTYLSIRQDGNQVLYGQSDVTPYDINDWENYCWEYGRGLVEYRKGRRAEQNPFYLKNIMAE